MDGWARRFIVVAPTGSPFRATRHTRFPVSVPNVREMSLYAAWNDRRRFDGIAARSGCPSRARAATSGHRLRWCRCQAFISSAGRGPHRSACRFSPNHGIIEKARRSGGEPTAAYRYRSLRVVTFGRKKKMTRRLRAVRRSRSAVRHLRVRSQSKLAWRGVEASGRLGGSVCGVLALGFCWLASSTCWCLVPVLVRLGWEPSAESKASPSAGWSVASPAVRNSASFRIMAISSARAWPGSA